MGMLPGDEGGVEEHEGDEDYCRWAWLGLGATGEAPTAGAVRGGAQRGVQRCSGEGGRRWVGW